MLAHVHIHIHLNPQTSPHEREYSYKSRDRLWGDLGELCFKGQSKNFPLTSAPSCSSSIPAMPLSAACDEEGNTTGGSVKTIICQHLVPASHSSTGDAEKLESGAPRTNVSQLGDHSHAHHGTRARDGLLLTLETASPYAICSLEPRASW